MKNSTRGYTLVLFAYITWGVLPIYWDLFSNISPVAILFHRVFWSMILLGILLVRKQILYSTLSNLAVKERRNGLLLSAGFLGLNWLTYIYAIHMENFVEASLGYFICPMLQIACGALFLQERLSYLQKTALTVITTGILLAWVLYGGSFWISVVLASSWAGYTFVRKTDTLGTHAGVFLETLLLTPFLSAFAFWTEGASILLPEPSVLTVALLLSTGIATALPQISLVSGAKHIPMQHIGLMQYLAPTLMIVVSAVYFGQSPEPSQILCMVFVFTGIAIFVTEQILPLQRSSAKKSRCRIS